MSICASCLDVIYDNYPMSNEDFCKFGTWDYGNLALLKDMEEWSSIYYLSASFEEMCISMGSDIEDHACDETETGGETLCRCGCH
jgi:hypothetical protein